MNSSPIAEATSKDQNTKLWPLWMGMGMLIGLLVLISLATRFKETGVGKPLPDLDLKPLLGAEAPPAKEDLAGKVIVLHFWGTWCPDCRREYPDFVKLYEQFKDDAEVVFLSVSCSADDVENDLPKLKADTLKYYEELGTSLPTYSDPVAYTRGQMTMIAPSGSSHYPTTVITDKKHKVFRIWEERLPSINEVTEAIHRAAKIQ
jgi:cytochrome c biogenesis protein CcmG/thiol:disulfide interchange protein DsbE